MSQYDSCSTNSACGCFPFAAAQGHGICAFLYTTCSQLVSCHLQSGACYEPGHVCVQHPRCHNVPLCYPVSMAVAEICPPRVVATTSKAELSPETLFCSSGLLSALTPPPGPSDGICASAHWNRKGVTVAGGNGAGAATNQLSHPTGVFVGDDGSIYVPDTHNHRVVKWGPGVSSGRVVAGNGIAGRHSDLLHFVDSFVF